MHFCRLLLCQHCTRVHFRRALESEAKLCFHISHYIGLHRSEQLDKPTIERQDAPEIHREITMLNTDNELTREIIEEDIDFKIPGLPHSICEAIA